MFKREGNLVSQPFDADKGQFSGEVFAVGEGISDLRLPFVMAASASQNGILLYVDRGSGASGTNQIVWYDRTGKVLGSVSQPGDVWEPSISPDGKMAAFARFSTANSGIWLHDLMHGVDQRFTSDASRNDTPVWSPNGDRIVFRSTRRGQQQLFIRPTNGLGKDELLPTDDNPKFASQWSKEGFVVYSDREVKTTIDLWVVAVDGDRKPVPFLKSEFDEAQGQISPDGHWMAYMSDVSGQREIYVRQFPSGQNETRISTAGGEQPRWRGDGGELFFIASDGKLMAVDVKAVNGPKPTFDHGMPAPLFHANIALTTETRAFQYDVTADGKRFLMATNVSPATSTARTPITVIVNWLKK